MLRKFVGLTLFAVLVLSACSSQPQSSPTDIPVVSPSPSAGESEVLETAYPGPEEPVSYPGPNTPVEGPAVLEPAYLSPQPGDENLTRSSATVELGNSEFVIMESYPIQVAAILRGYLPNPCHQLRAVVGPADDQNAVQIDVYSVVDPELMCTEVIEPFDVRLPLGSYQGATYKFYVNGELLGEVDS